MSIVTRYSNFFPCNYCDILATGINLINIDRERLSLGIDQRTPVNSCMPWTLVIQKRHALDQIPFLELNIFLINAIMQYHASEWWWSLDHFYLLEVHFSTHKLSSYHLLWLIQSIIEMHYKHFINLQFLHDSLNITCW